MSLAFTLILASCSSSGTSAPKPLSLDEIPIEQLRVTLKGYSGDWRDDTDQSKGLPAPPSRKAASNDALRIELADPDSLRFDDLSVKEALAGRRSRRSFSAEALTLDQVSFLTWSTQGATKMVRDEEGEVAQAFRTAPSGGARYPLETYLLVNRVDGLPSGVYRYLPLEHELLTVRAAEDIGEEVRAACYGQPFVADAAVVFVWAAVPYRTEWKYGFISHRMIAVEAGHACQNLYLAVETIEAGACAMLGYDQDSMDTLIGVDGMEEFVIYLACVGMRAGDEE